MGFTELYTRLADRLSRSSMKMNLRARMLATLIPVVIMTLLVTGFLTYQISEGFLRIPLGNEGRVHLASLIHEVEQFLQRCRKDLLIIAQDSPPNVANLSRNLANIRKIGGMDYRMLAFISLRGDDHAIVIARGETVVQIPFDSAGDVVPNLFSLYEEGKGLDAGETWISRVRRIEYPFPLAENPNLRFSSNAILFANPCFSSDGKPRGYLVLAVEMQNLKELFANYHLRDARIPPYPPEGVGTRYSYFFDTAGWILFDSGNPSDPKSPPSTDLARYGYAGILGNMDNPAGFRPDLRFESFWEMVQQVRDGTYGATKTSNLEIQSPAFKEHFCSYGPVLFTAGENKPPLVYGGIAFVDRSRLTETAGNRQLNVMLLVTFGAIFLLSVVIFSLAHYITRPLMILTRAVNSMRQTGRLELLEIPRASPEINLLKDSMNAMINKIRQQIEHIKVSERLREETALRVTAELEHDAHRLPDPSSQVEIAAILGDSPIVKGLRREILKAANVDADVLIIGETGTGKQLAAEAIHRHGRRSEKPFICVNCGELDENLLLDSLFGHVRGAFTEAKGDRKGAFLEANGGVLFLDEIQTASPSVQQALLRAISQKLFKPLGSDKDMEVDVRVIAASNADLSELVSRGTFRLDLYFRLKVITIFTPSLREIKEDIPLLVNHYFNHAKVLAHKEHLKISKGTLERLRSYEWPGNVRELMNTLTRAVVMSEGPVVQIEDLLLETGEGAKGTPRNGQDVQPVSPDQAQEDRLHLPQEPSFPGAGEDASSVVLATLNRRQKRAYPLIVQKGSISRVEYQWAVGGNVPSRTAIYDLQDLVKNGLLEKRGSGPATRYFLSERSSRQKKGI